MDYALCHPANEPRIFIEAKGWARGWGRTSTLRIRFSSGVPLAVLTDGREWSFFLPAGKVAMTNDSYANSISPRAISPSRSRDLSATCATMLCVPGPLARPPKTTIRMSSVSAAISAASAKSTRHYQRLGAKLVAEEDEILIEVVAESVEGIYGQKPASDLVARFLQEFGHQTSTRRPHTPFLPPLPLFQKRRSLLVPHRASGPTGRLPSSATTLGSLLRRAATLKVASRKTGTWLKNFVKIRNELGDEIIVGKGEAEKYGRVVIP